MLDLKTPVPLSLYIHYPWCIKKCPYCDFNSHGIKGDQIDDTAYVEALCRDLEMELPRIWGRRILSVFIGGGTPSLLSINGINRLMTVLRSHLNVQSDTEVTMEANPGTHDSTRFESYLNAGVNRLSIGAQSFNNAHLTRLGRIHDSDHISQAFLEARHAGFDNINLDLMFGLPGQDCKSAMNDLELAIALGPEHISWYQLTIEPNTVFYSQPPTLPDDELTWSMQASGKALLAKHDYAQYEISAYAKPGNRCRHNLNYWQFGDYLGIGAGAHGKITDVAQGKIIRNARHRIPDRYTELAGTDACIVSSESLGRHDIPLEFMMNTMRLNDGIPSEYFYQRTGMPLSIINEQLQNAEGKGLIENTLKTIIPTEKGHRYLNDLLQIYMPPGS